MICFFGFGNKDLPQLPEGWCMVERPDYWVFALSPDDHLYFVTTDSLYPALTRFNPTRIDTENPETIKDLIIQSKNV